MKSTLHDIRSIESFDLKDKRVFLRLDLNVPIQEGHITDSTRIDASLPTIQYALERGARLVLASHLGRPESEADRAQYSLEKVGESLQQKLNKEVILVEDPRSDAPKALLQTLRPQQILLLENLRFDKDETKNGLDLARRISSYTDIYINDAFGASHRTHSTIVALPQLVAQKGIGFLMKKEVEMLDKVVFAPESPFVILMGGAKVSDKISVLENLIDKADAILIGGAMAYTFLAAQNIPVGRSRVEKEKLKYAHDLLTRMQLRQKKFLLPVDHRIVQDINNPRSLKTTAGVEMSESDIAVDIGPKTVELYRREISRGKTVFWNGPMGIFETPEYSQGTMSMAQALADCTGTTIVGGGDSAAALQSSGLVDKVTHLSTGGGASLEFIQGDKLPGLEALRYHKPTT